MVCANDGDEESGGDEKYLEERDCEGAVLKDSTVDGNWEGEGWEDSSDEGYRADGSEEEDSCEERSWEVCCEGKDEEDN